MKHCCSTGRAITFLLTAFTALAIGLAGIGLYGVLAYDVYQRTREIGIRGAIGATRGQIVGLILRQSMSKTLSGLPIGLAVATLASRYLTPLLFGLSPTDPLVFFTAFIVLIAVAGIACWWPARQAARVDPVIALRAD
ncbi:MAG: FtsX-like permease family protein [Candidatus Synoicihabitans palmerolidicus]|nr:FtsX-like permease family protein [Candidatus Synoicihabitans palmerolidicus]